MNPSRTAPHTRTASRRRRRRGDARTNGVAATARGRGADAHTTDAHTTARGRRPTRTRRLGTQTGVKVRTTRRPGPRAPPRSARAAGTSSRRATCRPGRTRRRASSRVGSRAAAPSSTPRARCGRTGAIVMEARGAAAGAARRRRTRATARTPVRKVRLLYVGLVVADIGKAPRARRSATRRATFCVTLVMPSSRRTAHCPATAASATAASGAATGAAARDWRRPGERRGRRGPRRSARLVVVDFEAAPSRHPQNARRRASSSATAAVLFLIP